jgi:hypothetical protein
MVYPLVKGGRRGAAARGDFNQPNESRRPFPTQPNPRLQLLPHPLPTILPAPNSRFSHPGAEFPDALNAHQRLSFPGQPVSRRGPALEQVRIRRRDAHRRDRATAPAGGPLLSISNQCHDGYSTCQAFVIKPQAQPPSLPAGDQSSPLRSGARKCAP